MSTFGLVHGAWHGGWCWERLVQSLGRRGHDTIVMDLPCQDGTATFETYAETVLEALSGVHGQDIVLVGHSLGAMTIPVVAARQPVRLLVALCGVLPNIGGTPWADGPQMAAPGTFDPLVTHPDGSTTWPDVQSATRAFYQDCTPQDAAWAFERLRRQNSTGLWAGPYPLELMPEVPWVSIACRDDVVITTEWSRHAAQTKLGIDVIEMEGDHSPFLGRPDALAEVLVAAVDTDPT